MICELDKGQWDEYMATVKQNLQESSLELHEVPSDNNSLFRATSFLAFGITSMYKDVINSAIKQIRLNSRAYQDYVGNIESAIEKISNSNYKIDYFILKVLAFKANLHISGAKSGKDKTTFNKTIIKKFNFKIRLLLFLEKMQFVIGNSIMLSINIYIPSPVWKIIALIKLFLISSPIKSSFLLPDALIYGLSFFSIRIYSFMLFKEAFFTLKSTNFDYSKMLLKPSYTFSYILTFTELKKILNRQIEIYILFEFKVCALTVFLNYTRVSISN